MGAAAKGGCSKGGLQQRGAAANGGCSKGGLQQMGAAAKGGCSKWGLQQMGAAAKGGCSKGGLQRAFDGAAAGLKWDCYGIAMGLLWDCYGIAMGLACDCYGIAMGLARDCYGIAMGLLWGCGGAAMGLARGCGVIAMRLLCDWTSFLSGHAPSCYDSTVTVRLLLCGFSPHLGKVSRAFWRGEPCCAGLPFGGRIDSILFYVTMRLDPAAARRFPRGPAHSLPVGLCIRKRHLQLVRWRPPRHHGGRKHRTRK